jgi:hypothetical protein
MQEQDNALMQSRNAPDDTFGAEKHEFGLRDSGFLAVQTIDDRDSALF